MKCRFRRGTYCLFNLFGSVVLLQYVDLLTRVCIIVCMSCKPLSMRRNAYSVEDLDSALDLLFFQKSVVAICAP